MLRMILILLPVLPLLLPQGVCVCGAGCRHESKTNPTSASRSTSTGCTCKCHHHHESDESNPTPAEQPVGNGQEPSGPCTPDKEHAPGCPFIKVSASLNKTVQLHGSPLLCFGSHFPSIGLKVRVRADTSPPFLIAPGRSLFLTLRALLI
jgi:hypothetical protein